MQLLTTFLLSLVALLLDTTPDAVETMHAGPGQEGAVAELLFIGDAMQHSAQYQKARRSDGTYDYSACFTYLEDDIRAADYAVVNLECPLGGPPYSGYPCFCAPDSYAAQLQRSGFDMFLTANNHCLDKRDRGLVRTIGVLDSMQVDHLGTWVNQAQRSQRMPYIRVVNGIRIAFLNYTYGTNGIKVQGDVVVDELDRELMKRDIDEARAHGAQAICANLHWGVEYTTTPVQEQRDLADFLVAQGVDLIIGGHPHVIEPFEMRYSPAHKKNVLLVYSLGNFISNMNQIDCRGGALVKVALRVENGTPVVQNPRYRLFYVQKPVLPGENYVVIPEDRPEAVRSADRATFARFMQRAHEVMSHNVNVPCESPAGK